MKRYQAIATAWWLLCAIAACGELPLSFLSTAVHPELRKLQGPAKTILHARQLSEVLYFFEAPAPMRRGLALGEDGTVSLHGDARGLRIIRRITATDDAGRERVIHQRPVPTRGARERAAALYREALSALAESHKAGASAPVPFEFLGVELFQLSDAFPSYSEDLERVRRGYAANPSDLTALARLELALIERALNRPAAYRKTIAQAVMKQLPSRMDFRADIRFRRHLRGTLNFARPETCLLFLSAEDARLSGRPDEARRAYALLVQRAPGSPFAWEALAKMTIMPGADPKRLARLREELLQTWPLVWGCPRRGRKLTKQALAEQLPRLLAEAGRDETREPHR